ncbi:MAG: hypothetical protein ACE37K_03280 [Planctomycetota bacterium]
MRDHTKRFADRPGPSGAGWRRFASVGLIGWALALAQPASGQARGSDDPWIDASHRAYTQRFRQLLLDQPSRDLSVGWQLARDLGRPVVPLLWQMFAAERSSVDRRLVLLIAAVVAGGPAEDERLFSLLDQQKPLFQERTMAALLVALGPHRSRPMEDFVQRFLGPNKEPEDLLDLAVRLAAARYPRAARGVGRLESNDPGLLAAAAFAGMPIASTSQARQWRRSDRHSGLFQRGALLGEGWRLGLDGTEPTLLQPARDLLRVTDARQFDEREAAMLLLARAGRLDAGSPPLDWRMLHLAASQSASRPVLRKWLKPTPPALDERPARLGVAYALWMPIDEVVRQREVWGADERIRTDVAVALALRLCLQRVERPIRVGLEGVPEWSFVVWASGGGYPRVGVPADPRLAELAGLVADGRASRRTVREELELRLWRWGTHPGIAPWRAERELIRDLMLVGSKPGGGKYRPQIKTHLRYFPTGLDRDDGFFEIAVELYEFLDRPVGPVPSEYRLR